MKLSTLLNSISYTSSREIPPEDEVVKITSRSYDVLPGSIFVALCGTRCDGNQYIPDAIRRGASYIITDRHYGHEIPVPCLTVSDPHLALSLLCNTFYGDPCANMQVIGVTGTNGKTSTVHFLQHILQSIGKRTAICSTVSDCLNGTSVGISGMTTADPEELYPRLRQFADAKTEYLILEVSSHALALKKVAPIYFAYGLLTNLTEDHLDFHRTMEAYAQAKSELFAQSECVILPKDIPYSEIFRFKCPGRTYTYAIEDDTADFTIRNPQSTNTGISFDLLRNSLLFRINVPLFGNFTYDNSLLSAACALLCGASKEQLQQAFASMPAVCGRMEEIPLLAPFRVFCDYAHTPDALERALTSLRPLVQSGRLILLFGCGGNREKEKRVEMGRIGAALADFVIITEDNCRNELREDIFSGILREMPQRESVRLIASREDAIHYAIRQAKAGDVLLLAGKGHEEYLLTATGKEPFSERRIVTQAYRSKWNDTKN